LICHHFQDTTNLAPGLALLYTVAPKLPRHVRGLSWSSENEDEVDYKKDFLNMLTDPKVREQRLREMDDRSLLIGGGSEPRSSVFLDRVQFLNNALTTDFKFITLVSNGLIESVSKFADLTMTECLFKDNRFPYALVPVGRHVVSRIVHF
jgi:hypothetical protein